MVSVGLRFLVGVSDWLGALFEGAQWLVSVKSDRPLQSAGFLPMGEA